MTIRTNYFDGGSGYSASDFIAPMASLLANGVYNLYGNDYGVVAHNPNNLSVDVYSGQASINGYYVSSDTTVNVPITANSSGYNRIDLVIINVDTTNKVSTITTIQGTPSTTPTAPLTTANQLPLAQVFVGNNVSSIVTTNITDMRVSTDTQTLQTSDKYRQAIINSNFDIWQRATSFTNPNGYVADRWKLTNDGSGQVATVSRATFITGSSEILPIPKYFLRYQVTTAGTGQTYNHLYQKIEDVRTFAGMWVTLSFFIRADSTRSITVSFSQTFGTGGSPSGLITGIGSKAYTIGTGWTNVVQTTFIPSIYGKTLGTNDDSCITMTIDFPTGTTMTFDVAQVQLNAGTTALPYNPKTFQDELQECMRFYEKSYDYTIAPGTVDDNGQIVYNYGVNSGIRRYPITYRVRKRITPTVTLYDGSGTANRIAVLDSVDAVTNGITAYAVQYAGQNGFNLSSSSATKSGVIFHWVCDSEI